MNHAIWLLAGLCLAAVLDWRQRRIPNWLALALAGAGLLVLVMEGHGLWGGTSEQSAVGVVLALAVLLPFYALGWMGAGDVKLGAALGLWLGWQPWLMAWAVANGLALVHSLWLLWQRSTLVQASAGTGLPPGEGRPAARRLIPYGSYLCLAAVLVLMHGRI